MVPAPLSTGIPSRHRLQLGIVTGYSFNDENSAARLFLNDHTRVVLQQLGALSIELEGAALYRQEQLTGTFGTYLNFFGFHQGVEWDFRRSEFYLRLSLDLVARRGGLSGMADRLRLEYVPASKTFQIGVSVVPLWQTFHRNRPKERERKFAKSRPIGSDKVTLPEKTEAALLQTEHAMIWMDKLLTPSLVSDLLHSDKERQKFDSRIDEIKQHGSDGHTFLVEDSIYHRCLADAFAASFADDSNYGGKLADLARECLFEYVIVPVNRVFGQFKKPSDPSGFVNEAAVVFARRLDERFPEANDAQRSCARGIFSRVLSSLRLVYRNAAKRWNDSRLVWLPLNIGLRSDQFDSQEELNTILGRVVGQEMTNANTITYLFNDRWYYELERMIRETNAYHVLVIHDFPGKTDGSPDLISWKLIADGYLAAFTQAVEAIDAGSRQTLPDFTIFLDEHYFQLRDGRRVMRFLENLYDPGKIEFSDNEIEGKVSAAHAKLKEAIGKSESFRNKSRKELQRLFRVHVNVTNVFEPVYTEDALMRDHRKIAFRDIFESDPSSGVAIFTGQGVGRAYLGSAWEDRSMKVQGADLVNLKTAVRRLFMSQGYDSSTVPFFLQPRPFPADYVSRCEQLRQRGWTAEIISVFNETGYADKMASVAKAVLYNLMPPGATIVAPDSLWECDFWAGMFIAGALRGCQVFAISPGREQAPSDASITLEAIRVALTAMHEASISLADQIAAAGGCLRIGLYKRTSDVQDLEANLHDFVTGVEQSEFPKQIFHVNPKVVEAVYREYQRCKANGAEIHHLVTPSTGKRPKLHLKAQFFASQGALKILEREEWSVILGRYFDQRRKEVSGVEVSFAGISPEMFTAADSESFSGKDLISTFKDSVQSVPEDSRLPVIFFATLGSHNQDRRSMMLDGEDLLIVSGYESLVSIVDFALFVGTAHWISSSDQLTTEFPRQSSFIKSMTRWIKDLI